MTALFGFTQPTDATGRRCVDTRRGDSSGPRALRHHWLSRVLLVVPDAVESRLREIDRAGCVDHTPSTWQITLGVLRMWHRVVFRTDTIGTCTAQKARRTWRATLLRFRAVRFPFLLAEKAIAPFDFSGLVSSQERVITHLLGAHHDGHQFAYDLEMLSIQPGALARALAAARDVVEHDSPRHRWLRDLTVFDGYHESLVDALERAIDGDLALPDDAANDPDISFAAYLRWCAKQPATPEDTLDAWRAGRYTIADGIADRAGGLSPSEALR